MMQKEWVIAPQAPSEHLLRYHGFSPIFAQILFNRGFEKPTAARDFLVRSDLNDDPFKLQDMNTAVARINCAIEQRQSIVVYGDFDADGVCATALMTQALKSLGAVVSPYIPERATEGYGLNTVALQSLARAGADLVITVDCGIRSVADVAAGRLMGLDVIVTDHHTIGADLPPALAVVNPRRSECAGDEGLSGVGVAFMLAKALLRHRWDTDRDNYPEGLRLSDFLDLVALGTVADMMPLNLGLNRRLIRHGLMTMNELRRPGIRALANVAGLKPGGIRASHIGFVLGPRINAAGRLDSAMTAYQLLVANSHEDALPCAVALQQLNMRRQALTRDAHAAISERVSEAADLSLIFEGDANIPAGIVGLVAGRLAESFYRPAIILEYGEEQSRASCRSIPEFDITRALDECADLLVRHGGHAMAAGFTVRNRNLDALQRELERKAQASLAGKELRPRINIDCEIAIDELHEELVAELDQLEPTGNSNPPATFLTRKLAIAHKRRVGADGSHLKLRLSRPGNPPLDAIGFGLGERYGKLPCLIDAVYHPEINEWNGNSRLQMQLLDIAPAS